MFTFIDRPGELWCRNCGTSRNDFTPFSGMYPLLTDQLTWQFTMFDGPSKLGWDLGAAIVDGLADQDIIPILYGLAESYRWDPVSMLNWLAKNCKRGTYSIWCRQADLEESPLSTDQPGWYLTHIVCAGQTSKKPTFNRSASHTSQWISPMVDLPADLTKSPLWTSHPMLADVQFPTEQPDIGQSPS